MTDRTEQLFVSKLTHTEVLPHGRIRQTFDVMNVPGMQVVCESFGIGDGDLEQVSQVYRLPNGQEFDSADDALLAWDDIKVEIEIMDRLAHAMLRFSYGSAGPIWEKRDSKMKAAWIARARRLRGFFNLLGLEITLKGRTQ